MKPQKLDSAISSKEDFNEDSFNTEEQEIRSSSEDISSLARKFR
jgi:hypothetical protein